LKREGLVAGNQEDRRVFVTRPIAEGAMRRLAAHARVELWDSEMPPSPEELFARLKHADGVLSMVTDRIDAGIINALPKLRAISNLAVGVDNIDVQAATLAGIAVGHTPGILTETTADLAFGLLLAAARRIAEADRYVRAGRWRTWGPRVMLGHDVFGATLGIIGWGGIGRATARRARGFNMRVLYVANPKRVETPPAETDPALALAEQVTLEHLLRESDFVSIHVPLTDSTHHLIGAREFAMMKPKAIIVNTARGGVVDQRALVAALKAGRLAGAGLDVAEDEPIAPNDPLLQLGNVVITPHIGSASHATRLRMAELATDNLLDVFAGRLPRMCANPEVKMKP
jgi:glyoxylate reductase